ncbi:coiled-coil domain-containing protein 15 isoform X3 [Hemicordylus capensis]|uniref:coiled-coil domain-containing protein 15 isoform X3 n=1 Tax=Hemicordylus capensis TaxID=884348 RepID=UPI002304503E|nr:coiled-coil domain-containing protein 15 isoform X3 [Hemicordylus capensis]
MPPRRKLRAGRVISKRRLRAACALDQRSGGGCHGCGDPEGRDWPAAVAVAAEPPSFGAKGLRSRDPRGRYWAAAAAAVVTLRYSATAAQIEEEYKEQQNEKERVLKRFQEQVKRRVNKHVKLREKQQLQKSYEAAQKESSVVVKFSDSALQLTPKKSTCLYRYNKDSAICSSSSKPFSLQQASHTLQLGEVQDVPFVEHAKAVRKTVQQVRYRLASRKTVTDGKTSPELPGGVWESCPSILKSASHKTTTAENQEEDDKRAFPLVGYHDLPAELQEMQKQEEPGKGLYYTMEFEKIGSNLMRDSYPADSLSECGTETRTALTLWPGIDEEESRKQRQNQYLRYRRLFMDIEREQVKEQQRQRELQKKMEKIKKKKEDQRLAEEQKLQERTSQGQSDSGGKAFEKLEQLKLEDMTEKKKAVERQQKNKEYSRYVEALRAQMREKIKMYQIDLPPLCFCGLDFWDSHPDSCANNCMFYKNHKAYAQALQSVMSSCDVFDGGSNTRLAVHTFATVHARAHSRSEKNP